MIRRLFYKAQPIGAAEPVPDVSLEFVGTLPGFTDLQRAAACYDEEGGDLEASLRSVLAGGVYDALLRHMLLNRASLLRIRLPAEGRDS